jgi:transcriptional regulator with XRE-family HTH domain
MNQIERLRDELAGRFPGLALDLDAPADERGPWFLDVRRDDAASPVVVEWRPDRGFGVSTPAADDYGSGPDEVYANAKAALDRVVRLVLSGGPTDPPQAVRLAELRQLRGLSQGELAERAGVGQANVSRIEGRADFKVSTLARVVAALGGSLVLLARFPDGTERELEIGHRRGLPPAQADPGAARPHRRPTKRRRPSRAKGTASIRARRRPATGGVPATGA